MPDNTELYAVLAAVIIGLRPGVTSYEALSLAESIITAMRDLERNAAAAAAEAGKSAEGSAQ